MITIMQNNKIMAERRDFTSFLVRLRRTFEEGPKSMVFEPLYYLNCSFEIFSDDIINLAVMSTKLTYLKRICNDFFRQMKQFFSFSQQLLLVDFGPSSNDRFILSKLCF